MDLKKSTAPASPKRSAVENLRRFLSYGQLGKMLTSALSGCDSVIDVGCGTDSRLQYARFSGYKIGADGYAPALDPTHRLHDEYRQCDVRQLSFSPKSVDACVCLDVIEHLAKEDGLRLLESLERIARKIVVVATPNGFLPQPPTEDNPYQEHLSGWVASEFTERGYKVSGLAGYRRWRGMYGRIIAKPEPFFLIISKFTEGYFESRPENAFALFCVRDLR